MIALKQNHVHAVLTVFLSCLVTPPSRADTVAVQWEKIYNGPGNGSDGGAGVAVDREGNVIVAGWSSGIGSGMDSYTAKYAGVDGSLIWEQRYKGPGSSQDSIGPVAVDAVGNVIVTGGTGSIILADGNWNSRPNDCYTAKYAAADGALLWEKRYNGPANRFDSGRSVAVDHEGNVLVTAASYGPHPIPTSPEASDFYTVKYAAADGALLWEKRYNGPRGTGDDPVALAVDTAGNAIVTGSSSGTSGNGTSGYDLYTAKYASANGALLWERRYSSAGNFHDFAHAVAVDTEGNVVVTGTLDAYGNSDSYTAKYASSNGATLWEKRNNGADWVSDLAVDFAGNVIIAGQVRSIGVEDMYTAKYASSNGSLLWEKRYNGPGDGDDFARAITVDTAGNAIVTGFSTGAGGNWDIYTAKYAAADGALLWEKRYNGPGNLDDDASAVVINSAGSIVVTGRADFIRGDSSTGDFYTVKYASEAPDGDNDGLLDSWEVTHFGSTATRSALDDTDGDGAVELLEFAFGSDPKSSSSVPTPAVSIEGGFLTTTITKQPCVHYLVETSATLDAGLSAASTTVLTDTATTLKVRDNVPIGTQPGRFLRVRVTGVP